MAKACCLLVAALLTAGCSDDNKPQETVLTPIAKHITGKWQMTGYHIFEDGKWKEQPNDDNVAMAMDFRPDGTEVRVMTYPDGFTALATRTWSVNEDAGVLTDEGTDQRIHRLTANELVMESTRSVEPGTGEVADNQSRWTYRRATEQDRTMAERLVGKWRFSASYIKEDGEWVNRDIPEDVVFEFKENGYTDLFVRDLKWSVNSATSRLRMEEAATGNKETTRIEMPDEDTFIFYSYINIAGEKHEAGKHVFVRENK